jgi:hypothetical protein
VKACDHVQYNCRRSSSTHESITTLHPLSHPRPRWCERDDRDGSDRPERHARPYFQQRWAIRFHAPDPRCYHRGYPGDRREDLFDTERREWHHLIVHHEVERRRVADDSFDGDGILEFPNTGFTDAALSLDGSKILLLKGTAEGYQIGAIDQNGAVVQAYTPVVAAGGTGFAKMLVDDEGRILIGKAGTNNDEGCGQVIRLNADFSLDNTFGSNGVAYTPSAPFCYPLIEIDNLGRIVLGSYQPGCAGMWRFNADGTVDASFSYTLDLTATYRTTGSSTSRSRRTTRSTCKPNTWGWPAYLFKLLDERRHWTQASASRAATWT